MICKCCKQEIIEKKRTIPQNSSLHLWLHMIAEEARNKGLMMDFLVKHPNSFPITESLLKDFFRNIGNVMYHRDSTTRLTRKEFKEVQETFERIIAERLEISVPFPSLANNYLDE